MEIHELMNWIFGCGGFLVGLIATLSVGAIVQHNRMKRAERLMRLKERVASQKQFMNSIWGALK